MRGTRRVYWYVAGPVLMLRGVFVALGLLRARVAQQREV